MNKIYKHLDHKINNQISYHHNMKIIQNFIKIFKRNKNYKNNLHKLTM